MMTLITAAKETRFSFECQELLVIKIYFQLVLLLVIPRFEID